MATLAIPPRYWAPFLQSFSRRHSGWLVRMEIGSVPGKSNAQACDIALTRITLEPKPPDGEIGIMLAGAGGLTHWIEQPEAIEVEENEQGADQTLAIRSHDGSSTILRCGPTPLPERLSAIPK